MQSIMHYNIRAGRQALQAAGRPTQRRAFSCNCRHMRRRGQAAHANLPDTGAAGALTDALGGISSNEGRTAKTNNLVLGGDNSLEKWRELDAKVNEYPAERSFKAIGSGGQDFVDSMAGAVQRAVGQLDAASIHQRPSAKGNYVSVTIGPVTVTEPEQVIQVFASMREDSRLKWYM